MNETRRAAGAPKARILIFPFLWSGVYGLVFGLLLVTAALPSNVGIALRIAAWAALAVSYAMTARGALSRWMAPADRVVIGGLLSRMLGGPGRQPRTPENVAYMGMFFLGFCVALSQTPQILGTTDDLQFILRLFGGYGILCVLYGFIRQPRREAS